MRYMIPFSIFDTEPNGIVRLDDDVWIPFDPSNVDYQEYLKWVAEGNVAEEFS